MMTEEQGNQIIDLLKEISNQLDGIDTYLGRIDSNTSNTESNVSNLQTFNNIDDVVDELKKVKTAIENIG